MKVIFKVANIGEHKAAPAINTAREVSQDLEETEENYRDYVRPIGDVRPFQTGINQATKDRYDR